MNFVGGYADQWWKLSSRFERALRDASSRLDASGQRSLKLGSPVLVGTPKGDVTRVPIILTGGARELPAAYVAIEDTRIDRRRIDLLVRQLESVARAVIDGGSATAGKDLELHYP